MAVINRDPEVGRYLNRPVDEPAIAAFFGQIVDHWRRHGYGPWALESCESEDPGRFFGFAGLAHVPAFLAAAGPAPELGWRLARSPWGRGLATEAAIAARQRRVRPAGGDRDHLDHPPQERALPARRGQARHAPQRTHRDPVIGIDVDISHQTGDQPRSPSPDRYPRMISGGF